jgi:glucose-6-phosphate isomerase
MTTTLPTALPAWKALSAAAADPKLAHLRELLRDANRPASMAVQAAGLTLDFSRQRLTPAILTQLVDLARQSHLESQRDAMYRGDAINLSEDRAVLHVALRGGHDLKAPWPAHISQDVQHQLARMLALAERIRAGEWLGPSRKPITDVVAIGIGGSDLGPRMAAHALQAEANPTVRVHFVSNPDASALHDVLQGLDPLRTGFIVASKTFTTQETLLNANSARRWLADAGVGQAHWPRQFIALTSSPAKAHALGYEPDLTLAFWDWVGGRYSLWSVIGMPLAIAIGEAGFRQMLAGAHAMDRHFATAPLNANMPVLMALLGIWQRNFLNAPTQLVTSYTARLGLLPSYLQQMDMESNGKRTHADGQRASVATGPIVWGGLGIDGQHAYYQLLHQGCHNVAIDFIGTLRSEVPLPGTPAHLQFNQANMLAQAQALSMGRDAEATRASLLAAGISEADADRLTPHRSFDGNVSSNLLWLDTVTPYSVGALVALYEHKVFCQAAVWQTLAFDQWGVELGKTVANEVLGALSQGKALPDTTDAATLASLAFIRHAGKATAAAKASPPAAPASPTSPDKQAA